MIVLPHGRDQYFNADTVNRLRVGIVGNPVHATAAALASSIDRLVHGPYRAAIGVLRARIAAASELEEGALVLGDAPRSHA